MTRYQPRSLEPLPGADHSLRGVVDEIRAAERPPGEHVHMPDVAWPRQPQALPPIPPERPRDVPLVVGMIEPDDPPSSILAPVVFWVVIVVAFVCVLAEAGGWL